MYWDSCYFWTNLLKLKPPERGCCLLLLLRLFPPFKIIIAWSMSLSVFAVTKTCESAPKGDWRSTSPLKGQSFMSSAGMLWQMALEYQVMKYWWWYFTMFAPAHIGEGGNGQRPSIRNSESEWWAVMWAQSYVITIWPVSAAQGVTSPGLQAELVKSANKNHF